MCRVCYCAARCLAQFTNARLSLLVYKCLLVATTRPRHSASEARHSSITCIGKNQIHPSSPLLQRLLPGGRHGFQSSNCVSIATPLLIQCFCMCSAAIGTRMNMTKLVEWPVVESVPCLIDVLYTGHIYTWAVPCLSPE
jgi:hypothetical protein